MTGGSAEADILPERNPDDDFMSGNPRDLFTRGLRVGNVLQHLRAKDAVERIVRKIQPGGISLHRHDTGEFEIRLPQIERRDLGEVLGKQPREMAFPRPDIEYRTAAFRQNAEKVFGSLLLPFARPVLLQGAHSGCLLIVIPRRRSANSPRHGPTLPYRNRYPMFDRSPEQTGIVINPKYAGFHIPAGFGIVRTRRTRITAKPLLNYSLS